MHQNSFSAIFVYCFFMLLPSFLFAQAIDPYPPTAVPDRIILTWSDNPAKSQSVTWRTDTNVKKAWGEIALAEANPDFPKKADTVLAISERLVSNQNEALYHSVCFTNLKPKTKYLYRVGDGTNYSEWFQFKTAAKFNAPFSFLYFGDAQNNVKSMWSRCIRQGYSTMPDIDFIIHAGDLINRAQRDEEWGEWFYAGGWIYGMRSNIACPGNHEYYSENMSRKLSPHWQASFTFPQNGPESLRETVYYTDYQGMRIISLNTMAIYTDSSQLKIQTEWLENVLKNNSNKWTVVTQHHPIYSTAAKRDNAIIRDAFQPLFEKYNVDLVLQGHDHTYGRGHSTDLRDTRRDLGPVYVVSVSGPKMYLLNFDDWMERGASNTQLYQLIKVNGNRLEYEAYTATGKLYDKFILKKKSNGRNRFNDLIAPGYPERVNIPAIYRESLSKEEIEEFRERYKEYVKRKKN